MQKALTFFLIDDDEDDHELFRIALEEADASIVCVTAKNGQEALNLLKQTDLKPDLIFLDLNMPMMSGRECLAELKKDHTFSTIPVVIFSTSSDPKDREETKVLGAADFITKPSKISDLTVVLNTLIVNQDY